jgi:hypothetical protein
MLKRLSADQLLEGAGRVFKSPFGIVGHSSANGLEACLAPGESVAGKRNLQRLHSESVLRPFLRPSKRPEEASAQRKIEIKKS